MSSILSSRDINAPITNDPSPNGLNSKETDNNNTKPTTTTKNTSMDYHRHVLQSKLSEDKCVSLSPSCNIASALILTSHALPH